MRYKPNLPLEFRMLLVSFDRSSAFPATSALNVSNGPVKVVSIVARAGVPHNVVSDPQVRDPKGPC